MLRFSTKAKLVEALEARRSWAEQHDVKAAASHEQAEQETLDAIRYQAAKVANLTSPQLKRLITSRSTEYRKLIEPVLPSCPMSAVTMIEEALDYLAATGQERFVFKGGRSDPVQHVYWLLTHTDVKRKATVCQ